MQATDIINLRALVAAGALFTAVDDQRRVEAFIPPGGHENHAPNLVELPNGDLLCAWFSGSEEGRSDVSIMLARLRAGAAQWSRPVKVSDDPMRSEQNPLLFAAPDGRLWLFYTAQLTRSCSKAEWSQRVAAGQATGSYAMQWTSEIRHRISDDGGYSWGPVQTFAAKPSSFCRQPMVVLSNGDWLFPMYYSVESPRHADDHSVMRISTDQGATWFEVDVPGSRGRVHPSAVELTPGKLVALLRSRAADRIYLSRSDDNGRTWSVPERTALPNNNASIQAARLQSGDLAVIFNHASRGDADDSSIWLRQRYPVTIAISPDAGATWPYMRHIDTGDNFCGSANEHLNRRCEYPCLLVSHDGTLHLAYAYRDRQCIKYVRVAEDWVRAGGFAAHDPAYFTQLFG